MENVIVSVIIPTFRDWDKLAVCLNALSVQDFPKDEYEIIVVNNDADTTPPEPIRDYAKFIEEPAPGSYAARNAGIKIAKGKVLAFTDSDCIPDKEWIKNSVMALRRFSVDRIAGHVELFYGSKRKSVAEVYEKAFAFNQRKNASEGFSVTANLIAYRRIFDDVGFFNDDLMSGGDVEWNKRATQRGYSIGYCSDCVVKHPARSSLLEIKKKSERVAGGLLGIRESIGMDFVIRSLLPPLRAARVLNENKMLTLKEKLIAFLVAYYLKANGLLFIFLIKSKLRKAPRV
ncbi:glycosyltransferase [Halomonas sp. McH1-25]|uniref:glycosyltransferase n=1 Tax=unclassified Halomonas TaxID=2609666 RepID=UPI001EF4968F|nr:MULTISPECIES: glycosyltransferase [unclassified Halomonas]MCG7601031.1 glycosyltransferase [Halomonas sp. McH1-25]MCP1344650.1 glycosyltransferase [Halomonas sp. FL8]MCP1360589.1 glycosyltransferase [Halomonas sp. BBD45]MCP1365622.1 glycosyltransferase [Halomonas sp. BBD48]